MKEMAYYKSNYEIRMANKMRYVLFESLILASLLILNIYDMRPMQFNTVKDFIIHFLGFAIILLSLSVLTNIYSIFSLKDKCIPKFKPGDIIIDIDSNKYEVIEVGHLLYLVKDDKERCHEVCFNEKKFTIFKSLV